MVSQKVNHINFIQIITCSVSPSSLLKQTEYAVAIIAMDELDTWRQKLEAERQQMLQASDIDPNPVREIILPNQYISWASPYRKGKPDAAPSRVPDGIHWGLICYPDLYFFHWSSTNFPVAEESDTIIVDGVQCSRNDGYAIINDLPPGNYLGETSLCDDSILETDNITNRDNSKG
jgi:hypothetical protein